jgi:hypothetical protein
VFSRIDLFNFSGQKNIPDHETRSTGDQKYSQRRSSRERVPGYDDPGEHCQFDEYNCRSFQ